MKNTKERFEEEAKRYDDSIVKIIPFYNTMVDALIGSIPFDEKISVLDLGCGTGNITKSLIDNFPNSYFTCIDIAENMIEIAEHKLKDHKNVNFIVGDFSDFDFEKEYDVVVSSLAIHHIKENKGKIDLFQKIFNSLKEGGVFYNADVVLGSSDYSTKHNLEKWTEFMKENSPKEVYQRWIKSHEEGDRPSKLVDQLNWLKEVGFVEIDVTWKYYGHCVYGGKRDMI